MAAWQHSVEPAPDPSVPQQDLGVRGGIPGIQRGGGKELGTRMPHPEAYLEGKAAHWLLLIRLGEGGSWEVNVSAPPLLQGTGSEALQRQNPPLRPPPSPVLEEGGQRSSQNWPSKGAPCKRGRLPSGWRREPGKPPFGASTPSLLFPQAQPGQPRGSRRVPALWESP